MAQNGVQLSRIESLRKEIEIAGIPSLIDRSLLTEIVGLVSKGYNVVSADALSRQFDFSRSDVVDTFYSIDGGNLISLDFRIDNRRIFNIIESRNNYISNLISLGNSGQAAKLIAKRVSHKHFEDNENYYKNLFSNYTTSPKHLLPTLNLINRYFKKIEVSSPVNYITLNTRGAPFLLIHKDSVEDLLRFNNEMDVNPRYEVKCNNEDNLKLSFGDDILEVENSDITKLDDLIEIMNYVVDCDASSLKLDRYLFGNEPFEHKISGLLKFLSTNYLVNERLDYLGQQTALKASKVRQKLNGKKADLLNSGIVTDVSNSDKPLLTYKIRDESFIKHILLH